MYDASRDKALPPLGNAAGIEQARRKTSETTRNHSHYREEFSNGSWLDSLNDAPMDRVSGGSSLEGMGPFGELLSVSEKSNCSLVFWHKLLFIFPRNEFAERMPWIVLLHKLGVKNVGCIRVRKYTSCSL